MAQIKFYRGANDLYDATTHANGVYFSTDSRTLWVGNINYGLSDDEATLLGNLANSKMVSNITYSEGSQKLVFSWVGGSTTEINLVSVIGEATESTPGLMSADHVKLLNSLSDSGEGEEAKDGILTRMENAESAISTLEGQVGDLEDKATTFTEAIEDLSGDVSTLQNQIQGLNGAMHFIGSRDEVPTYDSTAQAWSDQGSYSAGDVIFVGNKEYVCDNQNVFIEFGDNGDLATKSEVNALTGRVSTLETETGANSAAILEHTEAIKENADAITVLNSGIDVEGSVKKIASDIAESQISKALEWNEVVKVENESTEA